MTIIKQVSVKSAEHAKSLKRYLDDGRAIARSTQNVIREDRWFEEMAATRAAAGHDGPSRSGGKSALMQHQIIAFLADDFEDGRINPAKAMAFANQWVQERYPNHECAIFLHLEKCTADRTERLAAHIALNVTDLETGRRLHEGPARQAARSRAKAMREMDERWGLRQVVAGERNSRVHAMQPTLGESLMQSHGQRPEKDYIRSCVAQRIREIRSEAPDGNRMRELSRRLGADGIRMTLSKSGKQAQFCRGSFRVNGNRLGRGYSLSGLAAGLGMKACLYIAHEIDNDMYRQG